MFAYYYPWHVICTTSFSGNVPVDVRFFRFDIGFIDAFECFSFDKKTMLDAVSAMSLYILLN